jgi:cobalamin biosynthesis Mg chelatase CobN
MKSQCEFPVVTLGLIFAIALWALAPRSAQAAQTQTQTQSVLQAQTQDTQANRHVVSLDELSKDSARPSQTRQADEASIRELLSTEAGQKALKSAKVDYEKVDKAVSQLSDDDLAQIAQRSRQAQSDFAAGGLTSTLIVAIVLIVVLIVVLSIVF